jgi:hypothetical protein
MMADLQIMLPGFVHLLQGYYCPAVCAYPVTFLDLRPPLAKGQPSTIKKYKRITIASKDMPSPPHPQANQLTVCKLITIVNHLKLTFKF